MESAKQTVKKILARLPEGATFEEIQYRIYVREKIERGLKDADAGRFVTDKEIERRLAKCRQR